MSCAPAPSPRRTLVLGLAVALTMVWAPTSARAEVFPLWVTPGSGAAGSVVDLNGSGLSPGGYTMTVQWDGVSVDSFTMPAGDTFTQPFVIPAGATLGSHTITVCVSCGDPEFEVTGSAAFDVTSTGGTGGDFDVQILTMEITQGVRGDLELRNVPLGGPLIPDDGTFHVMNRRTVVRVYPWIDLDPGATPSPLHCVLRGERDGVELPGSPLQPVNVRVAGASDSWTLAGMRGDPMRSWNFVLPMEWVRHSTVPGELLDPIQIDLKAEVNPPGLLHVPERAGADANNEAHLLDQDFAHVNDGLVVPFVFHPILIDFLDSTNPDMPVFKPAPSIGSVIQSLHQAATVLPIPAGGNNSRSNMIVLPPRWDSYEGTMGTKKGKRRFKKEMVRRYFPSGRFGAPSPGNYYTFMFGGACGGHAYLKSAFVMSTVCDFTFAHELVHAIGQEHAGDGHGEGDGGGYDRSYPGDHGQVETNAFGFDVYAMTARPPLAPGTSEGVVHDYMSYGDGPEWTSLYQWDRVAEHLEAPEILPKAAPLAGSAPGLILSGVADAAGPELDTIFQTNPPPPPIDPVATAYALRFRDATGTLLMEHTLLDDLGQEMESGGSGYTFTTVADPPTGWAAVAVAENGLVLQEWVRSASTPVVSMISPADNDVWPASGSATVMWTASDADLDPLTIRVEGSLDGVSWFALADDSPGMQATVLLDRIPAGDTPMWVRVQASDGLNVGVSNEVQVLLAPRPPFAYLIHPADGAQFMVDQPIPLLGLAGDWQQGSLEGTHLTWLVDGGWVANGNAWELTGLSPGFHTVELTAYNDFQLAGQMSVQIEVIDGLDQSKLDSPPNGVVDVPLQLVFQWRAVAGANGYRLQVALDNQFSQLVLDAGALLETDYRLGGLDPLTTYHWRVRPQSATGVGSWSKTALFTTGDVPTSVDPLPGPGTGGVQLHPPTPNPFNPRTTLQFTLEHAATVQLDVFDLRGRHVVSLARGELPAGVHRFDWSGTDRHGRAAASGVYIARLDVPGYGTHIRKMSLVK